MTSVQPATPGDLGLRKLRLELREQYPVELGLPHHSHDSRFLEVLAALGQLAAGGDRVETILDAACGVIAESLAVDGALVLERTGADGGLVVRAGAGCLAATVGEALACGPGTQAAEALERPGVTASADAGVAWPGDPLLARHRLAAAVLVALPGGEGPLGLFGAYESERRDFEPRELAFLQAAAALVAAALGRDRAGQERRRLEARLVAAERLASLGALAGGVAHELNNPLTYVTANLAFIAEEAAALAGRLEAAGDGQAEPARQLRDAAADTRDGVEAMRGLVRDLQTLAQIEDAAPRPLDLTPVLESSINLVQAQVRHRARIERTLDAALPRVRASEAMLGQVFLGLLLQAARDLPEETPGVQVIRVRAGCAAGDRVAVEVSGAGGGTGELPGVAGPGPSACRSAVEALGGVLEREARPGQGVTCRVLLPVVAAEAGEPRVEAAAPAAARARLLVVDDEPMVATVLARMLGDEYEVVAEEGARAALERLRRGERFDLVLSDLLMPEMSGMDLFRELQASSPELAARMIFLSGGAFTTATREFVARPGVVCLEKPFDLPAVRGTIARRLARR